MLFYQLKWRESEILDNLIYQPKHAKYGMQVLRSTYNKNLETVNSKKVELSHSQKK